jgi:hypothetical protein
MLYRIPAKTGTVFAMSGGELEPSFSIHGGDEGLARHTAAADQACACTACVLPSVEQCLTGRGSSTIRFGSATASRTHLMHTNINLTTSRAWSMIAGRHGMAPLPSILETTQ